MDLDPRYVIARETGFVDYDDATPLHAVSLELAIADGATRNDQLVLLEKLLGRAGVIDPAFSGAPGDLLVATAWLTSAELGALADLDRLAQARGQRNPVRRFEYAQGLKPPRIRPVPSLSLPRAAAGAGQPPSDMASGVRDVFAVIDYGCPFFHPVLAKETAAGPSTRIRAFWDQQPLTAGGNASPPSGFSYGTELTRGQLDRLLGLAGGRADVAYERLRYEAMRKRASHGAHALGMLLDSDPPAEGRPPADAPDVLFVQLPQGVMSTPSRAALSRCVVDALVWIESRRERNERVILSLSKGSSQGPNDGSSIVEQALSTFTQWGPGAGASPNSGGRHLHRVYIAAGNGYDERLHAQVRLQADRPKAVVWRVPPGGELPASVEVWLPTAEGGAAAEIEVEVLAPDGRSVGRVQPGQTQHWPAADADAVISLASTAWTGVDCTLCLIRMAPTAVSGLRACAPYGDWTIRLRAKRPQTQPVHLYIGRVKPALGFPLRAVQSTFVSSKRSDTVAATGAGTLQGFATAQSPRVVRAGGFVGTGKRRRATEYSSRGPSRDGSIPGPDVSVKVDDGGVLKGRRSIGNHGGVTFRMDGTSVAAPLAAKLDRRSGFLPKKGAGGAALGRPLLEGRKRRKLGR